METPSKTNSIISQMDINDKEIELILKKQDELTGLIQVISINPTPETESILKEDSESSCVLFNRLKHQFWQLRKINEIIEDMISRIQL